jgi:hypothetical protein
MRRASQRRNFSDPGFKDVPEPWNFGFPIAVVEPNGSAVLTKVAGTGGEISLRTSKEQMYEVHDPANYLTPDVVVDFITARLSRWAPTVCVSRTSVASLVRRR